MKYDDIITYFENDEKLNELLGILKNEYFNVIDDYAQQFVQGILQGDIKGLLEAKTVLNGILANLNPIYSKSLSLKKQKEYRRFVELKEGEGKFSASSAVVEAKAYVEIYRDIRDILCGYIKSAEGMYFDIKDTLDRLEKEFYRTEN